MNRRLPHDQHPSPADHDHPGALEPADGAAGQTIETPKGEPFRVIAVRRGERVTVSPLDGGREWDVPARSWRRGGWR